MNSSTWFRSRVTPPDPSRGRRAIQLLLGLAISAAMIWFAFRNTAFADVWDHITAMRVLPMAAAVALATLTFVLRVPRWQLLLRCDDGTEIPRAALWHAIAIGFAANNTLPFRLGEVLRVVAVSRLAPVSMVSAASSLVVERVLDAVAVVLLTTLGLLMVELPEGVAVGGVPLEDVATRFGVVGAVALAGVIVVATWPALATRTVGAVTPRGRVRDAALQITERLLAGISALRDVRLAVPAVAWTLAMWTVNAAAFHIGFAAFGIEAPFAAALILQGVLVFGIAAPQGPGFVGVFEVAIQGTLLVFGISATVGLAYAIAYHVTTFIPITILGVASLLRTGLSLRDARTAAPA
jgi:uncharacterized membrane protein YbhN (UPF0104 family)